jgi:hypothetical protein
LRVATSADGHQDELIADADAAPYFGQTQRQEPDREGTAADGERNRGRVAFVAMGLLDDAIREHLDLKRRRGADPAEVERAEREALGPVRRGPEAAGPDDLPSEVGGQSPLEHETGREPEWESSFEESEPFPGSFPEEPTAYEEPAPYQEPAAHHEPPAYREPLIERDAAAYEEPLPRDDPAAYRPLGDEPPPPRTSEPPLEDDPFAEVPPLQFEPAPHAAPGSRPPRSDETAEYDVQEELDNQGEDVLEETPEFLQDAPEHDRLWFEQRPPRDFDFNE